jgi:hypothetical protein
MVQKRGMDPILIVLRIVTDEDYDVSKSSHAPIRSLPTSAHHSIRPLFVHDTMTAFSAPDCISRLDFINCSTFYSEKHG